METFQQKQWRISYKTSSVTPEGKPTDILHDFYLPALSAAVTYDRVAGYFRSSSLAAASQGYTAFLRHEGHMRLIVGSDMAPEDVGAILQGDNERMARNLLNELSNPETWEKPVLDGVNLLSRMVASGQLEVRVAFRVHAKTGAPMGFTDIEDGYVHEKWFIMSDAIGACLYGSGSLNESKTALVVNAENIDLHWDWEGGTDQMRVDEARREFDALWDNSVAHMRVFPLPEAVRQRLITFANDVAIPTEIDGTSLREDIKPNLEEILKFAVLRDAPKMPLGRYIGMYSAPVEPWPHQEIVIRRLVETWPYSYLLCDEVGLGKTVEAALAIRSLVLSGFVKRVLIAAPASLTQQWQRELRDKALLAFARTIASPKIRHGYLFPEESFDDDYDLFSPNLNIISTGLLAREERAKALADKGQYDIALVDEAHYARRKNPRDGSSGAPRYGQLYLAMRDHLRPKTRSLWMATATPMQIDPIEVYDLFRLTQRTASFEDDPSISMSYFNIMGKVVEGKEVTPVEWAFLGASYRQIEASDPYIWRFIQDTCVNGKNRKVLSTLRNKREAPKRGDIKYLPRPLFAASPLSRVMMRHTRELLGKYRENGELNSNLAKRHVLPIEAVHFTEAEALFYSQLELYCAELTRQILKASPQNKQMMFFLLSFLQLRFASSLYAIEQTLKRRKQRVERTLRVGARTFENDEELRDFIEQMEDEIRQGIGEDDISDIKIDMLLKNRSKDDLEWEKRHLHGMIRQLEQMKNDVPSKILALLRILEARRIKKTGRIRQTVLFTRFLDSVISIRRHLSIRNPKMRVGIYSGQRTRVFDTLTNRDITVSHEEIKRLFLEGEIDLLLCTDAAAEGLNLQTADMIINFDLGWNPMKIEQRIGRIDRIGQKHEDIFVLNMCYLGSAEETVYGRLLSRLQQANLIVGVQQISLLPVEPKDFRALQTGALSEEVLANRAIQTLKAQRRNNASMEMSAEEQYAMYNKASAKMREMPLPARLSDLWEALTNSEYFKALGGKESDCIWHLPADETRAGIKATIRRDLISDDTQFLTWGNPQLDALIDSVADQLPEDCKAIRRIDTAIDGKYEIVGYIVSTTDGERLVTSIDDLKSLKLDPDGVVNEDAIGMWRDELRRLAQQEIGITSMAHSIQNVNRDFAKTHQRFIASVAIQLLTDEQETQDRFLKAIGDIEAVPPTYLTIPASNLLSRRDDLLFFINSLGERINVPMNDIILRDAIEMARREASEIRIKKSDITSEEVIRRLRMKMR